MDYKRILRLYYENKFSCRAIAESCGCGKTTINEFLKRFKECQNLSYPLSDGVTNEFIEQQLYHHPGNVADENLYRSIDPETVHKALTKKGETLKHLWQKYNAIGIVDGKRPLSYRQYCRRYSEWLDNSNVTFHIQRYPGINLELDYAGKKLLLHDRNDYSRTTEVTIFISALSFSDYFYIEGMTNCDISNWIRVNNNALEYFGGVTQTVTPDNCKVAVSKNKDWINPDLNKDFQAWAEHNGTVITPAKVKSPRWKPTVEGHVKIVTMHILVEMDEMTFYTLEELNKELWKRMNKENSVNFSGLSYSRKDLFDSEEKDALLALPGSKYEYLERKTVKVGSDFSFIYDSVHYTMPRKYLREELNIRASETKIYVYNKNNDLVRTHERSYTPKSWVVIPSDMPKEYADYGYWNIPFFLQKATKVGPNTHAIIEAVIAKFKYPVQSFRSCFGILRFAERYGDKALEMCCQDAMRIGKCNYSYIANTITTFCQSESGKSDASKDSPSLKPRCEGSAEVTGRFKDDDFRYSLSSLLKRQEEGDI